MVCNQFCIQYNGFNALENVVCGLNANCERIVSWGGAWFRILSIAKMLWDQWHSCQFHSNYVKTLKICIYPSYPNFSSPNTMQTNVSHDCFNGVWSVLSLVACRTQRHPKLVTVDVHLTRYIVVLPPGCRLFGKCDTVEDLLPHRRHHFIIFWQRNTVTDTTYPGIIIVNAPSQWETTLHCNVVSHWLGACTKWSQHT